MTDLDRKERDAEPHRPVYHFSPETGWMNDPNGMVYHDGRYHLFYQAGEKRRRWDHATSTDLIDWTEHGTKIPATDGIQAYSGGAVVDEHDTAGFGEDAIVCMYTGHHGKSVEQDQRIAYSTDGGETVHRYEGNPVLADGHDDWRDPNPFWYEPTGNWRMVVARVRDRDDSRPAGVEIYESENLLEWEYLSTYESDDESWECPDLYRLPVENANTERWVLTLAVEWDRAEHHIGHFDGETFTVDTVVPADAGNDFYAAQSWANRPASDRREMLAWMNNWEYAHEIPDGGWKGSVTVPREVRLRASADDIVPIQRPHAAVTAHRTRTHADLEHEPVSATDDPLEGIPTDSLTAYELLATIDPGDADSVTLTLRADEATGEETRLTYDHANGELRLDRSDSGAPFGGTDYDIASHPLTPDDGTVRLRLLVDRNSITTVANDGEQMMTNQIYPDTDSTDTRMTATGGTATVERVTLYDHT